jgi:hypothetical protein
MMQIIELDLYILDFTTMLKLISQRKELMKLKVTIFSISNGIYFNGMFNNYNK